MEKLILSVSFGTQAPFRWKGKSCPNDEGHLCCLGHDDTLVMDGQCQDEFSSLFGSQSGTGADERYVPLDPQTHCVLSPADIGSMLFANACTELSAA